MIAGRWDTYFRSSKPLPICTLSDLSIPCSGRCEPTLPVTSQDRADGVDSCDMLEGTLPAMKESGADRTTLYRGSLESTVSSDLLLDVRFLHTKWVYQAHAAGPCQ